MFVAYEYTTIWGNRQVAIHPSIPNHPNARVLHTGTLDECRAKLYPNGDGDDTLITSVSSEEKLDSSASNILGLPSASLFSTGGSCPGSPIKITLELFSLAMLRIVSIILSPTIEASSTITTPSYGIFSDVASENLDAPPTSASDPMCRMLSNENNVTAFDFVALLATFLA